MSSTLSRPMRVRESSPKPGSCEECVESCGVSLGLTFLSTFICTCSRPAGVRSTHTTGHQLASELRAQPGRRMRADRGQGRLGGAEPAWVRAGSGEAQPQVLGKNPGYVATGARRTQQETAGPGKRDEPTAIGGNWAAVKGTGSECDCLGWLPALLLSRVLPWTNDVTS